MNKTNIKIIADLKESQQSRIALLEDGKLAEVFIEYDLPGERSLSSLSRQGDIFKARVEKIIPAIDAAFVSISTKAQCASAPHNAFLYLNEDPELVGNLKAGQEIIVQITKNARANKAPRVSTKISVPGRWVVLMKGSDEAGVSRRISDLSERKRLKKIADEFKENLSDLGIIIRTAAEGVPEEFLREDLKISLELWNEIKAKAKTTPAPCLLYRDTGTLGRVLRDEISGHIDEIIIDDPDEFDRSKNFVTRFFPEAVDVKLYEGVTPIFEYFGIEIEIQKALERKVWLKSGAWLMIDQAEALTVIDVNTGKFTSAPDMRATVLAVNKEAAEEISRQLRLRSIGGIVVVDFIDMENYSDRQELLKYFENILSRDKRKARVFSITRLGLVELTRKRERPDLKNILTRACPLCGGDGFVEREESVASNIKRFVRKITSANNSECFVIQASPHMAAYLADYIEEWRTEFGREIFIEPSKDLKWNKYKLKYQGKLVNNL